MKIAPRNTNHYWTLLVRVTISILTRSAKYEGQNSCNSFVLFKHIIYISDYQQSHFIVHGLDHI